jgi:hypothetical protein
MDGRQPHPINFRIDGAREAIMRDRKISSSPSEESEVDVRARKIHFELIEGRLEVMKSGFSIGEGAGGANAGTEAPRTSVNFDSHIAREAALSALRATTWHIETHGLPKTTSRMPEQTALLVIELEKLTEKINGIIPRLSPRGRAHVQRWLKQSQERLTRSTGPDDA